MRVGSVDIAVEPFVVANSVHSKRKTSIVGQLLAFDATMCGKLVSVVIKVKI